MPRRRQVERGSAAATTAPCWRCCVPAWGLAGLLAGMAVGLKLTNAPHALALAAAAVLLPGGWRGL